MQVYSASPPLGQSSHCDKRINIRFTKLEQVRALSDFPGFEVDFAIRLEQALGTCWNLSLDRFVHGIDEWRVQTEQINQKLLAVGSSQKHRMN